MSHIDTTRIKPYIWIGATFEFVFVVSGFSRTSAVDPSAMDDFFLISVAARMLGMHPQTLRKYDRLGLIQPSRTIGSMRVYSQDEIERLRAIKRLVDDAGINLAGVQRLLSIAEVVQRIRPLMRDEPLSAREARRLSLEIDELTKMLGLD
jgi:MerR family transcriptional regulator, heat shock protein HspR